MLDSTPSPTPTPQLTPTPTIPPTIAPAADTEPPSVPANARAISRTDTAFTLAWDASTDNVGVAGYTIDRGASLIQTTIATTATLGGLTASTIYTVTVTAHDAAGNVSPASAAITITTNPAISAFADLYEPDNSFDQARPIATGETQHHAF
jgi:chitodextrinase